MKVPLFVYLICAGLALLGGGLLLYNLRNIWIGIRAKSWPQTVGTILKADTGELEPSRSRNPELHVLYRYEVDGRTYESTRIHAAYISRAHIDDVILRDEYLNIADKKVVVYYHPENPARAFLAVGFYSGSLPVLFAGCVLCTFGICFGLMAWFSERGNHEFLRGITFQP